MGALFLISHIGQNIQKAFEEIVHKVRNRIRDLTLKAVRCIIAIDKDCAFAVYYLPN